MSIERHRDPENGKSLCLQLKEQAHWTCQQCGKVCRKHGESVADFLERNFLQGTRAWKDAIDHPQKYCLTIAHLDQNPENNESVNPLALCCPCHLVFNHRFLTGNIYAARERQGQMKLALSLAA